MITVQSRSELDSIAGKRSARAPDSAPATEVTPPAAAPPSQTGLSPALEQTLSIMAQQIAAAAHMAAESHQSIRSMLADRENIQLEGEIVRDQNGKMVKIIISIKK